MHNSNLALRWQLRAPSNVDDPKPFFGQKETKTIAANVGSQLRKSSESLDFKIKKLLKAFMC